MSDPRLHRGYLSEWPPSRLGCSSRLVLAVCVLVVAAGLVILAVTAAPHDRGIPEESPRLVLDTHPGGAYGHPMTATQTCDRCGGATSAMTWNRDEWACPCGAHGVESDLVPAEFSDAGLSGQDVS